MGVVKCVISWVRRSFCNSQGFSRRLLQFFFFGFIFGVLAREVSQKFILMFSLRLCRGWECAFFLRWGSFFAVLRKSSIFFCGFCECCKTHSFAYPHMVFSRGTTGERFQSVFFGLFEVEHDFNQFLRF